LDDLDKEYHLDSEKNKSLKKQILRYASKIAVLQQDKVEKERNDNSIKFFFLPIYIGKYSRET
jgi:hypothetical protein